MSEPIEDGLVGGRSAAGSTANTALRLLAFDARPSAEDAFAILPQDLEISDPISVETSQGGADRRAPRRHAYPRALPSTLPSNLARKTTIYQSTAAWPNFHKRAHRCCISR